jgi:hypothetical protein
MVLVIVWTMVDVEVLASACMVPTLRSIVRMGLIVAGVIVNSYWQPLSLFGYSSF